MKYSYYVTENDYITLLAGLIRRRDRKPLRLIMLLLTTVGQMGLVAWLCLTRLERSQWMFYIVWSVLLAAFSVLRVMTARLRAKGTLYRLKDNGQLPEDYWKEHKLFRTKEGLVLLYGDVRTVCPPGQLTDVREEDGLLYLMSGENIFNIVPVSTFAEEEKKQAFLEEMRAFRETRPAQKEEDAFSKEDKNAVRISYQQDGKTFVRTQAAAFRAIYTRYPLIEKISLLKLAASIFLIVVAVMNPSVGTAALAIVLTIALNRNHFIVLTPFLYVRVKNELGNWKDGGEIILSAESGGIRMSCRKEQIFVNYKEISVVEDSKIGRLYSWGRLPMIIVPEELTRTKEGKAFTAEAAAGRQPLRYQ